MASPSVPVLWPGGTVVCLGGGPSLTREDVDACRGRVDGVIAINDAYRLAPWADVLYAADAKWWKHHGGVPSFTGRKYGLQPEASRWPGVQVLQNTGERGLEPAPTGLRTGKNSGYQAINLAVHLGATTVILLGYDMGHLPGMPSHWFGDHPAAIRSWVHPSEFIPHFSALLEPLAQLGVRVVNCSRQTALEVFPRGVLADVLRAEVLAG